MQDAFVGRQPICNHSLEVVADGLLFRQAEMSRVDALSKRTVRFTLARLKLCCLAETYQSFGYLSRSRDEAPMGRHVYHER